MKLLVTTRADEKIEEMTNMTHPHIKAYAEKVGADFLILSNENNFQHPDPKEKLNGKHAYRIFEQYDLFDEYDRILQIDSDMFVTPDCPNIFEEVPYEAIGTVYEDKGSRRSHRHNCIAQTQHMFGDVGWREGYINTGFFLASKCHKDIFQKIEDKYYDGFGYDDAHIGYLIHKNNFQVYELPYKWNHMTMFSEAWAGSPSRFDSYVIHYAGVGIYDGCNSRLEQMQKDYKVVYG